MGKITGNSWKSWIGWALISFLITYLVWFYAYLNLYLEVPMKETVWPSVNYLTLLTGLVLCLKVSRQRTNERSVLLGVTTSITAFFMLIQLAFLWFTFRLGFEPRDVFDRGIAIALLDGPILGTVSYFVLRSLRMSKR